VASDMQLPPAMANIIDVLNDLISTCYDSEEGFGKAAKGCHDPNLRFRFTGIAGQRADFAGELAGHVRRLGGQPADSGHVSGIQEAGWRELEVSIRPKDDAEFLAECERGEENTLRHYEQALTHEIPAPERAVVDRQRLAVQEALLELRSIELVRRAG
jgi:uncharacterized protein (TIGR02284 family)